MVVTTAALVVSVAAALALVPGGSFLDDDGSVHEPSIEALAATGITKGCNPPTNDRFCPDDIVSRATMAAFLARSLSLPEGPDAFVDDDGSPFESDINAIAQAGVTAGCNPPANDRYCPDRPVTRAQMAAMLDRAFLDGPPVGEPPFVDTVGSPFGAHIAAIADAGITKGCDPPANQRFCPSEYVTRKQMATFIVRALGLSQISALRTSAFGQKRTFLRARCQMVWRTFLT